MKLINKVVVITGGSSGIGAEIAKLFSKNGAKLTICARNEKALISIKEKLPNECLAIKVDVTKHNEVEFMMNKTLELFGRIDILINNAGSGLIKELKDTTIPDFDNMINSNLRSTFLCTKTVIPLMKRHGGGHIVNISSEAGLEGFATYSAYCAAKFGVTGFSKAIANELILDNIKVSIVYPGDVNTPFMDKTPIDTKLMKKYNIAFLPREKMLKPLDIARAVMFLVTQPKNNNIQDLIILPKE